VYIILQFTDNVLHFYLYKTKEALMWSSRLATVA